MKRLYLHIGYPKTGTTGLQRFLSLNSDRLLEKGILYPKAGKLFHQDTKRYSDAHYAITFALGMGHFDKALVFDSSAAQRESLLAEAEAEKCDSVVISSEYFITTRQTNVVRSFFENFDVKIVVYLRRHDHAFESSYNQALKTNLPNAWNSSIEAFILYNMGVPDVSYDYLDVLGRWEKEFGRSSMIVRPFEKAQNVPNIYADFMRSIGIVDLEGLQEPAKELNSSVSHKRLCAIKAVRQSSLPDPKKKRIVSGLLSLADAGEEIPKYLSPPMRNALLALHRPSYKAIAAAYVPSADPFLFKERWPAPSDPWVMPPEPSKAELIDLVLEGVAQQLKGP
jgi:hypothetical protein